MMVGRLLYFWDGNFSWAMLNFRWVTWGSFFSSPLLPIQEMWMQRRDALAYNLPTLKVTLWLWFNLLHPYWAMAIWFYWRCSNVRHTTWNIRCTSSAGLVIVLSRYGCRRFHGSLWCAWSRCASSDSCLLIKWWVKTRNLFRVIL